MIKSQFVVYFSCVLLSSLLLSGCSGPAGTASGSAPTSSDPPPSVSASEEGPAEPVLVDDPDSPYPMVEQEWSVDIDGDGAEELVQLRAEKTYVGNETEPGKRFESAAPGLHPYTLVVTKGEAVCELPLGRDSNDEAPLYPWYFSLEASEYSGTCWTEDRAGAPVLALWFDTISAGGAGNRDVYAVAIQEGAPVFLPVPMYSIQATLDEESMTSQVTIPETGCTETLELMQWLNLQEKRNQEAGYDFTFEPIYDENGTLVWPVAPGNIDGYYHAEKAEEGITLRQYVWGSAHVDGMGALVTNMSWENGKAVVLDQYFDWGY